MKNSWIEKLRKQRACLDGLAWASQYETDQEAWNACKRGNWMLWAWGRNCGNSGSESHRMLVLCAVECAKTSLKYIKDKEAKKVVKKSLKTTERWARGEESVTLEDVKSTADAAGTAAYNAGAGWYASAAWAAASAAWSVASYSSAAVAAAGYAAGYAAAREKTYKECADIIRSIQPLCPEW